MYINENNYPNNFALFKYCILFNQLNNLIQRNDEVFIARVGKIYISAKGLKEITFELEIDNLNYFVISSYLCNNENSPGIIRR